MGDGNESSLFAFVAAGIVFLIETPFCCKCCCSEAMEYLSFMEASAENPKGSIFRAVVYWGLCIGGSAICVTVNGGDVGLLLVFILLGADGFLYCGAFWQGFSGRWSNSAMASDAASRAKKGALKYAKENPDQVAAAASGAAEWASDWNKDNPEAPPSDSSAAWDAA